MGYGEKEIQASIRVMQGVYRDELRAAALDLSEEEPPAWVELMCRAIMVRCAEAVTREAAT
jgi:hypothetical protein